MDKSQKCNIEPKNPDMKEYTLCDFLSIKQKLPYPVWLSG